MMKDLYDIQKWFLHFLILFMLFWLAPPVSWSAPTIPKQYAKFTKKEVSNIQGTLEIRAVLYDKNKKNLEAIQYLLHATNGQLYYLHFVDQVANELKTGTVIKLKKAFAFSARKNSQDLLISRNDIEIIKQAMALPDAFGPRKTIAILVNFQDQPSNQPWPQSSVRDLLFNTVSRHYYESSYNQTTVVGDAVGWFTIALNSTADCDTLINNIPTLAANAAAQSGVDLSQYTHRIYYFPTTASCGWAGLGSVGRWGAYSQAWINGYNDLRVVAHEFGHNIGLYHSNRLQCPGPVSNGSCTHIEYGDYSDTMGWGPGTHFNSFQKERLGWLNYNISPTIQTVTTSGTYSIYPLEFKGSTPAENVKGIKFLRQNLADGSQDYYYLEFRQPLGFDAPLGSCGSSCDFTRGILIHHGNNRNANSSYIIDPTPNTTNPAMIALLPGQSYSDPNAANGGITITTNSISATSANVTIRFGNSPPNCTRVAPSMTISSNLIQRVKPGEARTYNVTVTNRDSAECAPAPFTFTAPTTSSFLTATPSTTSTTIEAGRTYAFTTRVASSPTTPNGFYYFSVIATNTASSKFSGVPGGFIVEQ